MATSRQERYELWKKSRPECDAFSRMLGYSQEYLDDINKHVDDYQARHANDPPTPLWEGPSDTESEDADGAPLSPPPSPRNDGLDLSLKAYDRRVWSDLARGLRSEDCGFGGYEKWRSHTIQEHSQRSLPVSNQLHKSGIRKHRPETPKKQRRFATIVSERLTRSKSSTVSSFYELSRDGRTAQAVITSSTKKPKTFHSE
ncbi:hypothetical protein MMC13_003476 [Lambiella insularis]|nr:hypothetical protein [Lambiella insularis]